MAVGLAVAGATALAGCPTPTGRMRGEPTRFDAGPVDCTGNPPTQGSICSSRGAVCVTPIPCGIGSSTMNNTCVCNGGTWMCQLGPCSEPLLDAGEATCPRTPVNDGERCTARQGGLSCPGNGATCDGGLASSPCWCTGTRWSCQRPICGDAGRPDVTGDVLTTCPPTPPQGAPCRFGLMCVYDDACTTGCVCGFDGRFVCTVLSCDGGADAGRRDAEMDAAFDGG